MHELLVSSLQIGWLKYCLPKDTGKKSMVKWLMHRTIKNKLLNCKPAVLLNEHLYFHQVASLLFLKIAMKGKCMVFICLAFEDWKPFGPGNGVSHPTLLKTDQMTTQKKKLLFTMLHEEKQLGNT